MELHQERVDGTYPFPDIPAYVTIKLDIVGSVSIGQDEEVSAKAAKVSTKTYVGYVAKTGNWYDEGGEFQAFQINLLRPGLPRAFSEDFKEETMCIPVFPNSEHPFREPLKLNKPLPWTTCYHSSFERVELRVPIAFASTEMATIMPMPELKRHMKALLEDQHRLQELKEAAHPSPPQPLTPYSQSSSAAVDEPAPLRGSISTRAASVSMENDADDESLETEPAPPIAAMSYDISAVGDLPDPQDLFEEIKIIEQLLSEAKERAPTRKARAAEETARAIAEANRLDDAAFGTSHKHNTESLVTAGPADAQPPMQSSSTPANPIRAVITFFDQHSFWGAPAEHPPAIFVALSQWKTRLCCCRGQSYEENMLEDKDIGPSFVTAEQPRARDAPEAGPPHTADTHVDFISA
ncbi:hypothetical protein HWV62_21890 [Athelia sp. TMB]|nr:hypothetical protein HWV62_21890 [Athelia sp. TMB]